MNDGVCTAPTLPCYSWIIRVPQGLLSSSLLTIFCFPFTPRVIFAAAFTASYHSLSICSWSGVPGLLGLPTLLALSASFSNRSLLVTFPRWAFSLPTSCGATYCRSLLSDSIFFCCKSLSSLNFQFVVEWLILLWFATDPCSIFCSQSCLTFL